MEFDHDNVRQMVEEDRLSSLPDELIHKILSSFDMRFAVQTCVLSSRWKLLWTSMPCLNFSSGSFRNLSKFAKSVTHVLSHRNHQIDVSSVKLHFFRAANQVSVRKIANYAFSHNVQELTVRHRPLRHLVDDPPFILTSQSLKHFTFSSASIKFRTPLNFPALTTLHLRGIKLFGDLFSKCVNLKHLTLETFTIEAVEVFDIITPHLSNLTLIGVRCCTKVINLIAPQLENLTMDYCSIKYLDVPPGRLLLRYRDYRPPLQLSKDGFHSLEKVAICLSVHSSPYNMYSSPYKEEDARKIINMLQELHTARYVTLSSNIIECLSSFPQLLLLHPSPFSNLISLSIDYSMRKKDEYNVKMSSQAINFLLKNSPSAKCILELPKDRSRS